MLKKLLVFLLCFTLLFICGCSQESKFGIQQFTERMNAQFDTDFETSDFLLAKDKNEKNYLFYKTDNSLITLSLDTNNTIKGVSLLLTESMDIKNGLNTFCQMCCILTNASIKEQQTILTDCEITESSIKNTDSNTVITVGRYKYTVVCNSYSITLFCDRV